MKKLILLFGLGLILFSCAQEKQPTFTSLFNGKDLSGWDSYLTAPYDTLQKLGLNYGDPFPDSLVFGVNNDPLGVFTVVEKDGAPAIRISGQIFGCIASQKEYENYHFHLQFKWGEKKWAPRTEAPRDCGLLYHSGGPFGVGSSTWMRSLECQIQERDCGDFYPVGGTYVDIPALQNNTDRFYTYKVGAPLVKFGGDLWRCQRDKDWESLPGEWTSIDLYTVSDTSIHVVNGHKNMVLFHAKQIVDGKEVPLTKGKLQIQSEGAEVFVRDMKITPIDHLPKALLNQE